MNDHLFGIGFKRLVDENWWRVGNLARTFGAGFGNVTKGRQIRRRRRHVDGTDIHLNLLCGYLGFWLGIIIILEHINRFRNILVGRRSLVDCSLGRLWLFNSLHVLAQRRRSRFLRILALHARTRSRTKHATKASAAALFLFRRLMMGLFLGASSSSTRLGTLFLFRRGR